MKFDAGFTEVACVRNLFAPVNGLFGGVGERDASRPGHAHCRLLLLTNPFVITYPESYDFVLSYFSPS